MRTGVQAGHARAAGSYFDAALTRINRGGQVDGGKLAGKGAPWFSKHRKAPEGWGGKNNFCSQSGRAGALSRKSDSKAARGTEAAGRRALCAVRSESLL